LPTFSFLTTAYSNAALALGRQFTHAVGQLLDRDQHRTGDVPVIEFPGGAHVQDEGLLRGDEPPGFGCGDFGVVAAGLACLVTHVIVKPSFG